MSDTKLNQDTSVEEGKNTDSNEGQLDTDANNQNNNQEKKLTQNEVNEIVKRAKLDAERAAKSKLEKSYEGKIIFDNQEAVDKVINDAIAAAKKEIALETVKKTIQSEYGLNDAQVARLTGDDEVALRKDAELVFGVIKQKQAPKLNPGNKEQETTGDTSPNAEINSWLKSKIKR